MNLVLKNYVAQQQNTVANTLKDFISEGAKQGFTLMKPKGAAGPVFNSKAGNPQLLFISKDGDRVYLRISSNLDAALTAGEPVKLEDSPIYHVDLDNGGKMLVIGMKAEAQEFEAVDAKAAFAGAYQRPEPAGK